VVKNMRVLQIHVLVKIIEELPKMRVCSLRGTNGLRRVFPRLVCVGCSVFIQTQQPNDLTPGQDNQLKPINFDMNKTPITDAALERATPPGKTRTRQYVRPDVCRKLEKRYRFCLRHSHVICEQDGKYYFEREGGIFTDTPFYDTPEAAIDAAIRHGW